MTASHARLATLTGVAAAVVKFHVKGFASALPAVSFAAVLTVAVY